MHVSIIAISRMGRGPEKDLMDEYIRRCPWKVTVTEIDMKKPAASADERKAREAEKLLAAVPSGSAIIALDEHGKALSSRKLAKKIDDLAVAGFNSIAFIIGGADGLHSSVTDKATLKLAFGALTWPHMLVRVMLAEQIYRVWSIHTGHPNHRD